MTTISGNNRHETFLIVRCSSVSTVVILPTAAVWPIPGGAGTRQ